MATSHENRQYLLFLPHISANDNRADMILVAATGPGTKSRRSIKAQQQSTKTHTCNRMYKRYITDHKQRQYNVKSF